MWDVFGVKMGVESDGFAFLLFNEILVAITWVWPLHVTVESEG